MPIRSPAPDAITATNVSPGDDAEASQYNNLVTDVTSVRTYLAALAAGQIDSDGIASGAIDEGHLGTSALARIQREAMLETILFG